MADIVVCCDGTWCTPDDVDEGTASPTNVVKLFRALGDTVVKKRYFEGVGTEGSMLDKLLGGGMGVGLVKNIKGAYRWLAANYREGDRIWLFGFSRGAFTVRCLAGMVTRYGLLDLRDGRVSENEAWKRVDKVYANYRAKDTDRLPFDYWNPGGTTQVHFLGVWDTVGALGIPDDIAFLNFLDDPSDYQFHDTTLNRNVLNARHALGLDEMRQSFIPTLWHGVEDRPDVKQIWFAGVHKNVGGGYADRGLSDITLEWMKNEAEGCGLQFIDMQEQLKCDRFGQLHDSLDGVFKLLASRPRNTPALVKGNPVLHESALDRCISAPITIPPYRGHVEVTPEKPATVEIFARDRWNGTRIYLEKGRKYRLSARGEWIDGSIACGPGGTEDGNFHIGEAVHVAASALDHFEHLYKLFFGTGKEDFWGSRRVPEAPWFALIGVIASGAGPAELWDQEHFIIGEGCEVTPRESGYLYCFANDAWLAYDNNRGSVKLTVE